MTNPPHATADTRRRRVSTGRMDEIMKPARNLPLTRQVFADSLGTTTPAQMEFILSQINEELVSRERPKCARLPKQAGRPYPVVSDHAFWPELVDFVDQVMQELDVPWRPPYPAHALDGGPAGLLATDLDGDIGIRIVGVVHVSVPSMTGSFVPSWGSRAPRTFRPRYGCVRGLALRIPPPWAFPPSAFLSRPKRKPVPISACPRMGRRIVGFRAGVRMRLVVAEQRSVGPAIAQASEDMGQGDGFVRAGGCPIPWVQDHPAEPSAPDRYADMPWSDGRWGACRSIRRRGGGS
nr:hypothetical protein [Bifidobacterium dentium]